jgi:SAM-dependent methyltransferase
MRGQRLWWVILVGVLSLQAVWGAAADLSLSSQELSPPGAREVPYVPTPQDVVEAMLHTAQVGPEDVLYDLGCGDGRIVVTAAQQFGARATGVDLNPARLSEARANARRAGVTDRVRFLHQDLFATELRDATVVTLYLLPAVNLRLRPRLLRDLQPGARVVSHEFDMGEWPPDQVLQVSRRTIYLWVVPAQVGGTWVWHPAGTPASEPYRLRLRQHFQRLSGTLQAGGSETPLTDSELRGSSLRFTVHPAVRGQPVRMVFEGRVEGDLVAGHVHIDEAATPKLQPWRAQRESAEGLLLSTARAR